LRQQVARRVIREAQLHRVEQREGDEQQHAEDAGEQVAVGKADVAEVDVEGDRQQHQHGDRPDRLAGDVDAEHEPERADAEQRARERLEPAGCG
jgi:hypothetical protein